MDSGVHKMISGVFSLHLDAILSSVCSLVELQKGFLSGDSYWPNGLMNSGFVTF